MPPKATSAKSQSSPPPAKASPAPKAKSAVAAPKAEVPKAKATAVPKAEAAPKAAAAKGGPPPKATGAPKAKAVQEKPASAAGSGASAAKVLAHSAESTEASAEVKHDQGDHDKDSPADKSTDGENGLQKEVKEAADLPLAKHGEEVKPPAEQAKEDNTNAEKKAAEAPVQDVQVAKKAAEKEGGRLPKEDSEALRAAAEAELQRLAALANGEVTVRYEMYSEKFPIENHRLLAATIDELYCLSDVMPGCFIHLSNKEYVHGEERTYVKEEPSGTFLGLMAGETYWCVVEQDPEQEKKDQERMKRVWAGGVAAGVGDRGSEGETCSCGWGAPCTNPMICKDWDNRFANAIKAGGNPILFNTTAS
mmetsp:Transcript_41339/g.74778  ORF Transcript_41339/g.74778 Transcript_41339/m.74778 type:complete len:364 (-) Transcript_41339:21-1112(-)